MKKNQILVVIILALLSINQMFAAVGDTLKTKVFDKFSMNRNGVFDKWASFPSGKKYQRVWLKYTVGCESAGQCEWDYTNQIFLRQHTGKNDSTLKQAPSFKVNGQIKDSVSFSSDTTYVNVFNATTKKTDSVVSSLLTIIQYKNLQNPTQSTDTLKVFTANYYRFYFDTLGNKIDSVWIASTQTLKLIYTPYYEIFKVINNFELGRIITPYAKFFPKSFAYVYTFDVTDYANFLSDSVQIRINYSGYTFGFTATIEFEMVEGIPAREVYKIENLYAGYFAYGNKGNPIENKLPLKVFVQDLETKSIKLKVNLTGHGMENKEGCAEFCDKRFYVKFNSAKIAEQHIWKTCGDNAIINQGGTWIFDRSNWCPGEIVNTFDYELNSQLGNNNIDIDLDTFTANGGAGYETQVQLIYYKDYAYKNDASIEKIIYPSNDFWQSRINPVCSGAKIILQNNGNENLSKALLKSQSGSRSIQSFKWNGNLKFSGKATVELPYIDWDRHDSTFKVWVEKPNDTLDENSYNNLKISKGFRIPNVMPFNFIVELTPNRNWDENSWTITNTEGKIIYSKSYEIKDTFKLIRDTINLGYGCYTLKLTDTGGDGLDFWYNRAQVGTGMMRITGMDPYRVLKSFHPDFGNFHQFNFRVGSPLKVNETVNPPDVLLYPNPAKNILNIELNSLNNKIKFYTIYGIDGKKLKTISSNDATVSMDISELNTGLYIVEIVTSDIKIRRKFLIE